MTDGARFRKAAGAAQWPRDGVRRCDRAQRVRRVPAPPGGEGASSADRSPGSGCPDVAHACRDRGLRLKDDLLLRSAAMRAIGRLLRYVTLAERSQGDQPDTLGHFLSHFAARATQTARTRYSATCGGLSPAVRRP